MIRGIGGKPYIALDQHLDIEGFRKLHPEICRGFALAREYAKEGTWMSPGFNPKDMSYILNWKPIYQAVQEYQALPKNDPIRQHGDDLFENIKDYQSRNKFTRYLKAVMGAKDPYIYYFLWNEGDWDHRNAERQITEESKYFPGLVTWIKNLLAQQIISSIGRVIFFHCEHDGQPFEHRDLDGRHGNQQGYSDHRNEFIHIRHNTKRGFYIWNPETQNKIYINSNSAFWNDQDWHGGEVNAEQEYGLRIDCVFTDEFRKKLNIDHLKSY
jgi:hypothetical protein